MPTGLYAAISDREPALLTALFTLVGGFLAQAGPGHIGSLKALGTSATVSGIQGLLTRERVISPATFHAGGGTPNQLDLKALAAPLLAHGAEPALAMSLVGTIIGFLLQIVGSSSTDLLQALGISAGIAGTQGILTRQQVYSPRTALMASLSRAAGIGTPLVTLTAPPPPTTTVAANLAVSPPAIHRDLAAEPGLISLLQRYRPEIRYDSLESYFADSAAIITDRPGNVLKRADGTVIAEATPTAENIPKLGLSFLAPQKYANGQPTAQTDFIVEGGPDYVAEAALMHRQAGYADRVHGRVVVDSSGATWLQYWFFMYYDDPGFLGFGKHEGDLEMMQVRLDASEQPDVATYSQHRSGVRLTWSQLELAASADGPVPVTYSARGSHANLPRAGDQISTRSFLPDHNDGRGPRIRPDLIPLIDAETPWCLWPGSWGGTKATGLLGQWGISANSPTGAPRHLAWRDPAAFHASCDVPGELPAPGQRMGLHLPGPPPPQLSVQPAAGNMVQVHVTVPPDANAPSPAKVVVGIVSTDASIPARTASIDLRGNAGTVTLPAPMGAGFEVRATSHAENGLSSPTASAPLP